MSKLNQNLDQLTRSESKKLDSVVLDSLSRYIINAGIESGHRLPSERTLASHLKISRSSIREALAKWETLGIVSRRKGSGTYLESPISSVDNFLNLQINKNADSLLNTLEVRRSLECEASALAAMRAQSSDLFNIEEKLLIIENAQNANSLTREQEWDFLLAIYQASHNPLFEYLVTNMHRAIESFFEELKEQRYITNSLAHHRELYNAIASNSPQEARELTMEIINSIEESIKSVAEKHVNNS